MANDNKDCTRGVVLNGECCGCFDTSEYEIVLDAECAKCERYAGKKNGS